MPPDTISSYLRSYGAALGLAQFPPLHEPDDPVSEYLRHLKRRPFPAQSLAIMGIVKCFREARCAAAVVTFIKSWLRRPLYGLVAAQATC